jgi:hypothetical protein
MEEEEKNGEQVKKEKKNKTVGRLDEISLALKQNSKEVC